MIKILIGLAGVALFCVLCMGLVILDAKLHSPVEIEEAPGPCTCKDCTPSFDWDAAERQMGGGSNADHP